MRVKDAALLVLLAALWGGSFIFIRIAAPVFGPVLLVELRVAIAAMALFAYMAVIGQRPRLFHRWRAYLVLGAVNAALPFCLISTAELTLNASWAAILNATTPLFAALVAYRWNGDPLEARKVSGLALGIVAVAVLVGGGGAAIDPKLLVAVVLSLGGALFYAIGGVLAGKTLKGEAPPDLAFGQQLVAAVLLAPVTLASLPARAPTVEAVAAVVALALACTALAYLLYFQLIKQIGAVKTLGVTYLVPAFGVLWSWAFLGEQIRIGTFLGLAMILLSVGLVAGQSMRLPRIRRNYQ